MAVFNNESKKSNKKTGKKKNQYKNQIGLVVMDDDNKYLGHLNMHNSFEVMCKGMKKKEAKVILCDLIAGVEKFEYKKTEIGNISVYGERIIGFFSPEILQIPDNWHVVPGVVKLSEEELKELKL